MKIEGVIFDWAGTTVDYGCFAPVQAFLDVFSAYEIEVTIAETRKPMGMLKWDHIKTMLEMPRINEQFHEKYHREVTAGDIDEMHTLFAKLLNQSLDQFTDLLPNVLETLIALKENNIKVGSTTGFTTDMMTIVQKGAKEKGYAPDELVTPDMVEGYGRPYPYMIFENMKRLELMRTDRIIKVGDTVSDIQEGVNAGVISVGVIEGSSTMGLTQHEYQSLSEKEQRACREDVAEVFLAAGAHHVIRNLSELVPLIEKLERQAAKRSYQFS